MASRAEDAIVVEVTPRIRAEHVHWDPGSIKALADEKKRVRISGWLLFDPYHPGHLGKFRVTLWEIHPIMQIEVEQDGVWVTLDDLQANPASRLAPRPAKANEPDESAVDDPNDQAIEISWPATRGVLALLGRPYSSPRAN